MRNKIFVAVCSVIFLAFLVGAPLFLFLTDRGVLPYENVGNQISAEKTYDEGHPLYRQLTAIEEGKMAIKDTYINYLPGFLSITNAFKPMKTAINRPMIDWLAACGREMTTVACSHVYSEQSVPPTCAEEGYTVITCRMCGEVRVKDATPALGHSFGTAEAPISAGCDHYGYTPFTCTVCLYTKLESILPPTGHDYVLIGEAQPTCAVGGSRIYRCADCLDVLTLATPAAHKYEYRATLGGYACTDCGKSFTAPSDGAEVHVHEGDGTVVSGGCGGIAYTRYVCSECGDVYIDDVTMPTGHRYTSEILPATCLADGYVRRSCEICGDTETTVHTAALGHRYEVKTVAPTVDAEGYDLYTCRYCSEEYKTNFTPRVVLGIDPPKTEQDPEGTRYSASLLATNAMFRIYELTATYPNGTKDASIVRVIAHDRDALYRNMLETVDYMEAMVEANPDVNWYFTFATNIEATALGDRFFPEESVRYIHEEFLNRLPEGVQATELAVNSFRDYADKFYITDHHWNYEGVQEAYYRTLSMLSGNYDDIEAMPLEELYVFDDVRFYGSLARQNASYDYYDDFGLYYYDLPEHTLTIDSTVVYGSQNTLEENLEIYLDGLYETKRGYNHYTEFYRVPLKIEYPENNTGRRLLVIGDSYSLPLIELVAAHFDVTYVRYEDKGWNALPQDLYFEEFAEEYGITDVLVIEEPVKVIMKGYGTHYPSGFLNIYPTRAYKKEED